MSIESDQLKSWYLENQRPLPWRQSRDPYRIWISEMMLQQTTVAAVVPYFERFMEKFSTIKALQSSKLEDVLEMWAGLGYYSRARNIHKAAQLIGQSDFPKSYIDLIELPGFGPYTARAVSSLSFDERVGVVDGNVIRVLSRFYGISRPWWKTKDRAHFQEKADALVVKNEPHLINQAVMDLGATICTPKSPACLLCPLNQTCVARKTQVIEHLPLKKPKKKSEVWVWNAKIYLRKDQVGLVKNDYLPFLKGQLIFPGTIAKKSKKPSRFNLKHCITHHEIYLNLTYEEKKTGKSIKWIRIKDLKKVNPSSILTKVLQSRFKAAF